MTIAEILTQCDEIKPNQYGEAVKIQWLSELDGMIKNEIINTHEGWEEIDFKEYDKDVDYNTKLLVKSPYSDIYMKYLAVQIDFNNGEYTRYNNSIIMFNTAYSNYANYYNRTHMPLQRNNLKIPL